MQCFISFPTKNKPPYKRADWSASDAQVVASQLVTLRTLANTPLDETLTT